MKSISSSFRSLRLAAALLTAALLSALSTGAAQAEERGKTAQGLAYVSGGVSDTEQQQLQHERPAYSLWVVTAAMGSGAYVADARLRIRDAKGELVFDRQLDGPWLLINLALGQYEVETDWQAQTVRSTTTIHAGDHHQILAYFKLADDAK